MRTVALLIGVCLLLGGCNMVITEKPLFSKADAAGAPKLKPGLWAGEPTSSCAFDEKTPYDSWPSCANGGLVSDDAIRGVQDTNGKRSMISWDYVLAAGDPRILQIHDVELAPGTGLGVVGYLYAALRPGKTDEAGQITDYSVWIVECGPPPPQPPPDAPPPKDGKLAFGTHQPLPGLVMDKDRNNCTTASPAALRNAAVASEKWAMEISRSHWVRER